MIPAFFFGLDLGDDELTWADDHHCIACGDQNPIGMKLRFEARGEMGLATQWIADKRFQGYAGVVHGGIIGLILDEVMVNLPWKRLQSPVVSAELSLRFVTPAKVGEALEFIAEMDDPSRRVIVTRAKCLGQDGRLIAEASAKCIKVKLAPTA